MATHINGDQTVAAKRRPVVARGAGSDVGRARRATLSDADRRHRRRQGCVVAARPGVAAVAGRSGDQGAHLALQRLELRRRNATIGSTVGRVFDPQLKLTHKVRFNQTCTMYSLWSDLLN